MFSSVSRSPGTASHGESLTLVKAGADGVLGKVQSSLGRRLAYVSPTVWLTKCWLSMRCLSEIRSYMSIITLFFIVFSLHKNLIVDHKAVLLYGFQRIDFPSSMQTTSWHNSVHCLHSSHVLGPMHFISWIEAKYKPSTHQELCYLNFELTKWVQEKNCQNC